MGYLDILHDNLGETVTIDRADAPPVTGRLAEANGEGCTIATDPPPGSHTEMSTFIFIDGEHVRGVSVVKWDNDKISG
jgi:hypothetical protein